MELPDSVMVMAGHYAPLDGMNEKGLCVSVNMIQDAETIEQNTDKPDKSTLLYLLGGLDEPTKGTVRYRNEDMAGRTETEKAKMRAGEFGFVFQQS